jgi:hypothetical protein
MRSKLCVAHILDADHCIAIQHIWTAGCWVLGAGCWVLGAGCWVLGAGLSNPSRYEMLKFSLTNLCSGWELVASGWRLDCCLVQLCTCLVRPCGVQLSGMNASDAKSGYVTILIWDQTSNVARFPDTRLPVYLPWAGDLFIASGVRSDVETASIRFALGAQRRFTHPWTVACSASGRRSARTTVKRQVSHTSARPFLCFLPVSPMSLCCC